MLKKLLLLVVALIAALLVIIWLQPDDFRLERSVTIAAPASVVFPFVNDFHRFNEWNPFRKGEADLKETYSGPTSGVGASYEWNGQDTGAGRMTILESRPVEYVGLRLEFLAPMEATDLTEFTVKPADGGVALTWAMSGPNLFMGKAMHLFGGMEAMVGPEFERGLARLKTLAEAQAARAPAPVETGAGVGGEAAALNAGADAVPPAAPGSGTEPGEAPEVP